MKGIGVEQENPTTIFKDNQGAITIVKNSVHLYRTKHIDIKYHYVQEAVLTKEIDLECCPMQHMIADLITKGLPRPQFEKMRLELGVVKLN